MKYYAKISRNLRSTSEVLRLGALKHLYVIHTCTEFQENWTINTISSNGLVPRLLTGKKKSFLYLIQATSYLRAKFKENHTLDNIFLDLIGPWSTYQKKRK